MSPSSPQPCLLLRHDSIRMQAIPGSDLPFFWPMQPRFHLGENSLISGAGNRSFWWLHQYSLSGAHWPQQASVSQCWLLHVLFRESELVDWPCLSTSASVIYSVQEVEERYVWEYWAFLPYTWRKLRWRACKFICEMFHYPLHLNSKPNWFLK